MPVYDYECRECRQKFDVKRRITESRDDVRCPACGADSVAQIMGSFIALGLSSKRSSKGGDSCSGCTKSSCSSCSS